jgi:TM2 domain-containing membrane protein YozV
VSASPSKANRTTIGKIAIFLGVLGIHKFMMGKIRAGVITLAVSIVGALFPIPGPLVMIVIGVIEGRKYLSMTDAQFESVYLTGTKDWF